MEEMFTIYIVWDTDQTGQYLHSVHASREAAYEVYQTMWSSAWIEEQKVVGCPTWVR